MRRLFAVVFVASAAFAQAPSPTDAVTYVEHPESGGLQKSGRTIPGSVSFRHGVDINSSIDVHLDATKLQSALVGTSDAKLTSQQSALLDQMNRLEQALANTKSAADLTKQIVERFATADVPTIQSLVQQRGTAEHAMLQSLLDTKKADLMRSGTPAESADRAAKLQLEPLLMGGINWSAVHDFLSKKLMDVQTQFAANAPDLGIQLEIRAHHITGDGVAHPVPLPGYNTVAAGPESHYEKIRFEVPTDQRQLFDQFVQVQKTTTDAKSAGEAVLILLKQDFNSSPAKVQLDALSTQFDKAKSKFDDLAAWRDSVKLKKWTDDVLEQIKANLKAQTSADTKLIADWAAAQSQITPLVDSVDAVRSLADLDKTTSGKSAPDALQSVLDGLKALDFANPSSSISKSLDRNFWQSIAKSSTTLRTDVQDTAVSAVVKQSLSQNGGPFSSLVALEDSVNQLTTAVATTVASLRDLLKAQDIAVNVATLPVPQGQTRHDIAKELDTSIDLQTLPEARNPNDIVLVSYHFYKGDKQIDAPTWSDRFILRPFGWSDKAIASLGMTRRQSESTYKPTAAISWILSLASWPKSAEDDLWGRGIKLFSGFGLTTMPLYFDPNQNVEVGVAPTLSFISDHMLVGYGKNLEVTQHSGFLFLSIRVFSRSGFIGAQ